MYGRPVGSKFVLYSTPSRSFSLQTCYELSWCHVKNLRGSELCATKGYPMPIYPLCLYPSKRLTESHISPHRVHSDLAEHGIKHQRLGVSNTER